MKRLKLYILVFCFALSIPLSYVVWRTYEGLTREERSQLRFFAETLFDDMEKELSDLVKREENRAVDEYNNTVISADNRPKPSPLASLPQENFVLGYLQNNPDGSLQTPLVGDLNNVPIAYQGLITQLQVVNSYFNKKNYSLPVTIEPAKPEPVVTKEEQKKGFADRYLASSKRKSSKTYLGQKSVRVEEITQRQAANLAQDKMVEQKEDWNEKEEDRKSNRVVGESLSSRSEDNIRRLERPAESSAQQAISTLSSDERQPFQVEVAPLQSVFIDQGRIFVFRRVAIKNQIFRQGFVIKIEPFLRHLAQIHFDPHPMAGFTRLSLMVMDQGRQSEVMGSGIPTPSSKLVVKRTFPAPFNFISAAVLGDRVPTSTTRRALNMALIALGAVMLLGLVVIYQSVRSIVDLSEKRTQFVSSVTHELKTPLTNIRMYVEMLEQGMAPGPEREQEYFNIIGSESTRLSRLINNVLEMSKLEKKQRLVHMQPGRLEDVLTEVRSVMSPKLDQEGFKLIEQTDQVPEFNYDREAMIQIFINLIENSIKFGRKEPERCITIKVGTHDGWVDIALSDTGPGIPRHALSKVFDDFYRADNALTRDRGGTGIGLSLVKKLVQAMGGHVTASNNSGPGCTITLTLPLKAE